MIFMPNRLLIHHFIFIRSNELEINVSQLELGKQINENEHSQGDDPRGFGEVVAAA